jgi:ribonuclease P protein component
MRLCSKWEFKQLFQEGKRLRAGPFLVLVRVNQQAYPRLGLAVSKRHVASAVLRNRIKRCVREQFRLHQASLAGLDIVVTTIRTPKAVHEAGAAHSLSVELPWQALSAFSSPVVSH